MSSGAHKPEPSSSGSNESLNPPSPPEPPPERKKEPAKRRRNPLSCAECRRLKLRCDRNFPCESCRKRGCAAICPEGALTTKGTRFVLANTEELHGKIIDMSERIRQLEDAIAASHPGRHPLLAEELLLVKVPIEFKNEEGEPIKRSLPLQARDDGESLPAMMTAFGTLKIGDDGYSRFFGQTARTEHFLQDDKEDVLSEILKADRNTLPQDIIRISQTFPFGGIAHDSHFTQRLMEFLPPMDEAWSLTENYYACASFMYVPCQREYFTEHVFKHVYDHIQDPEGISKHRLALAFAVLAHGALADLSREPYSAFADQLQVLSRASLAITPLLAEPSIHAIQTLHLLALYSALSNKPEGGPVGWVIQGLNVKLAEALGLHRDLEYWGGNEQDKSQIEVRRWVFWEMITLEGWLSLGLGRPPTLHFSQIDCKLPAQTQRAMAKTQATVHTWHTWKHGLAMFVNRILQKALDAKTPPYSEIMELDRSIQKYLLPPDADAISQTLPVPPPLPHQTPGLTMERSLALTAKFTAVLLLHRGFFAQALSETNDPMQSKYAASVLASYHSACLVIYALEYAYQRHPELTCRFGLYWSNAFTASISLCLLVTRATSSSYTPGALDYLNRAYELIQKAAPDCYPAGKVLPMATKLHDKAHAACAPYGDGQHPALVASRRQADNDDDELNVLGGKTNVVSEKTSNATLSTGLQAPAPQLTYPDSPGMLLQMPPTSHLDSVHPSLVQYVTESHWVSGMQGEEHMNQYVHAPAPLTSTQQSGPSQHPTSYQQQQLYTEDVSISSQRGYHTYTYSSGQNVGTTSGAVHNPQYTYYDQPYTTDQQQVVGSGQPTELHQPQPQNQYATWQDYVQQLYK